MLTVILIAAIFAGIYQLWLFAAGLIMLARMNNGKVTVPLWPGLVSSLLFALYFLL